jgi:hypothetical protein
MNTRRLLPPALVVFVLALLWGVNGARVQALEAAVDSGVARPNMPRSGVGPFEDGDDPTIALYHFDGDAADAVGDHDGTLHGNASFAPGHLGQALQLDGNGSYARIGNVHQDPPRDTSQGSVEMWVQLAENPSGHVALMVAGREYGEEFDDGFFLGKHTFYSENLVFMIWAGLPAGWQPADSGIPMDDFVGVWRHVRGTWGPRGVELWVDGELRGTNPFTGGLSNPGYSTILIGTNSWRWDMAGLIDEVRITGDQVAPVVDERLYLYLPLVIRQGQ